MTGDEVGGQATLICPLFAVIPGSPLVVSPAAELLSACRYDGGPLLEVMRCFKAKLIYSAMFMKDMPGTKQSVKCKELRSDRHNSRLPGIRQPRPSEQPH